MRNHHGVFLMSEDNIYQRNVNGKDIYIIGTAHVSEKSADETRELIEKVNPDSICIELDSERLHSMRNPDEWKKTDIVKVVKEKRASYLMVSLALSSYQRRLAKSFGVTVGSEMLVGIEKADEMGKNLICTDRPIRTTFLRIWRKMSFFGKMKLIFNLILSIFDDEEITKEDMEALKEKDMLESALAELSGQFPELKKYLVDERDQFLAESIKNAPGNKVVAIAGAAHVPGILSIWDKNESFDLEELNTVPEKKAAGKLAGWIIPGIILAMFAVTYFKDPTLFGKRILQWVVYNGSFSALGVLIAGGHILSALTSFVAAPITSLNPILAAGWFAGLVQAKLTTPTVEDFENVAEDMSSFKGFRRNRVIKVLMVTALGNLGCTAGMIAAGVGLFGGIFK